ncbi:MAG TPA: tRNA pseudouridine(38-40) synthase TruA, partial [Streptomyces sp.]|nr:tRNA pseudouridine(38-40) synthase TruA [Streptomyces sp.]
SDHPGGVDPLLRGHVLWHNWPLDVDAMNEAAESLLGEHDFAAYCKKREGATTIRTLQQVRWERLADGVLEATVKADAFCHNMVRSLVGAMLFVGDGHRPPPWPGEVLAGGVRDSAVHVVRPHGLTLEEVGYPADEDLAARNLAARNRRSLPSAGAGCC